MISDALATILAELKVLATIYQSAHWNAQGDNYYSDHLLYERLYNKVNNEIDTVAEKLLGVLTGQAANINPIPLLVNATKIASQLSDVLKNEDDAQSLLMVEKLFTNHLDCAIAALSECGELTTGVENMLQTLADEHEHNIYLLSRRIKSSAIGSCIASVVVEPQNSEVHTIASHGVNEDIKSLKTLILEKRKKKKKHKKPAKSPKYWYIGGHISSGPGGEGFGSSDGSTGEGGPGE